MKRGQLAIEFIILTTMAVFILFVIIIIVSNISSTRLDEKTYLELDDLGKTIQTELIIASEVEDGYERTINIPEKVNGREFNISNGNSSENIGYVLIDFQTSQIFYTTPILNGSLKKGYNTIRKEEGLLILK